ncbi:MAG: type II secretion system F family protein [Chthoniobacter sp.]|nr:type II secretion system F family protein [Chthoniobacter sp.]
MPTFRYLTRDPSGAAQSGTLAAGSREMLTSELRGRGLLVVDVEPVAESAPRGAVTWRPATWLRATGFDVELGFQQLATMLHSGLSLLAALRTVADQARRVRAAAVWHGIADRIEQGSTLGDALAAQGAVFSEHVVQLVRVGEATGNLDTALRGSAEHLERTRQMRLTVLNALAYPAIVTLLAVGVAAYLVLAVIPKIQKYIGGRGRGLPPLTQTLLDVTAFVQAWLPHFAVGLAAAGLALFFIYRWPPGRLALDGFFLKLPVVGGVLRLAGTAVLARGLGVLLESGVTLLDSLKTTERLVGNRALGSRIAAARETVLRGGTLAAALADGRTFMPMLGRMVAVGESAGTLAPVLGEVARFHENQLLAVIRRMSVLIEPVVILVVGGIVGFVYIAFFLALFSLAGGVR